jgi:hypothetical protein
MIRSVFVILAMLAAALAQAQVSYGPVTQLAVTSSNASASFRTIVNKDTDLVLLTNDGASEAYWNWGSTATIAGGVPIKAGESQCTRAGSNTALAAISNSGQSTTLYAVQVDKCPPSMRAANVSVNIPVLNLGTFVALTGGGPVTVANANVTASSSIVITLKTVGGTVGSPPIVKTITPGTGFTVTNTASDTSTYNYLVVN